MSFYRGLSIVRENLVYCIDPGSYRSYIGSGSNMTDLSSNKLNTTSGTFVANGNKGYYLKSDGGTISTASTTVLDTDNHTICMLFRMASNGTYTDGTTGSWNKIFGYEPSGTDRSPGIWRYPSNRRIHWTYNPGNTSTNFGPTGLDTDFNLNTDYYVVMIKNGANTSFWSNGTKYSGISNCANPKTSGSSPIYLMPGYTTDLFQLKALQIYNKALTDTEATQNWNTMKNRLG
jgi:hypothetical protein